MMDAQKLSAFCNVAELVFVELGTVDGESGLWFCDRMLDRVFVTEAEIYARLDHRKRSFFETARLSKTKVEKGKGELIVEAVVA